ncbi:unnamed protein product [Candidula unifasciata]|uniref:RWD domain-containing protein n=1 Tax=Candidula unifasciata TaxID=100452 RepID=A0A8S3Z7E8_9EUPU|nr:unnamed protein product [Candidula unifasciata]
MALTNGCDMTDVASDRQLDEFDSVKAMFPNRCRISSDTGEFSKIITVQPENMDATIKFQLPAAYPATVPEITIRSESLSQENITSITQLLTSKAREIIGQQMIRQLIADAETHLKVLGLKPGKVVQTSSHRFLDTRKQKNKKQKTKICSENEVLDSKLPSMKTADDVVKRIIWDEMLEKDDFIVGYVDRFQGLVEERFSLFSWENLASVDYEALAIPKHRIQYFKYKNVKVWDKTTRIDNVFGSGEGTKNY